LTTALGGQRSCYATDRWVIDTLSHCRQCGGCRQYECQRKIVSSKRFHNSTVIVPNASDGRVRNFAALGSRCSATSQSVRRISGRRERRNRKCTYGARFITVCFDTGNSIEHAQSAVKRSQPLPVRHSNGCWLSNHFVFLFASCQFYLEFISD